LVNRKILEINRNISDSWKFEQILKNISRTCGDGVRFSYQYVTEITSIDEEVMSRLSDTFKEFVDQLNQLADLQFRVEEEKNWIDNYLNELVYYSFVNDKNSKKSEDTKNVKKEDAKKSGSNTSTNAKSNNNSNTTNTGKVPPAAPTNANASKTSAPAPTNSSASNTSAPAPTNASASKTSTPAAPSNASANKTSTPAAPTNTNASKASAQSSNSNTKQEINKSTNTKEEKKEGDIEKVKDEKKDKENGEEEEPITKTLTIEKMKKYLNILFYFIRKYKDHEFTQQLYEAMNDDADEDDVEEEEIQVEVKDKKESHDIEVSDLECGDINNIYITKDFKVKGRTSKCTIFTFINNLKKWTSQLVACLLTLDYFNLHQFILLQCLRTKGISSWGANFIQVSYNKKTWNDQCINEFTARLNTLFLLILSVNFILFIPFFDL